MTTDILAHADWEMIPLYMRGGVRRWIESGILPGSFLTAVVSNDLRKAVGKADDVNVRLLHEYISFFYNYAPSGCWGSPEKVEAWHRRGGHHGAVAENAA